MEKQKGKRTTPTYPDHSSFVARHPAALSAGIVIVAIGAACMGGTSADSSHWGVDSNEPASDESVFLPAAGFHRAWLSDGMSYVDYQVEILVSNLDLAAWVQDDEKDLLAALDATLATHPLEDFDDKDRDLAPIQDELLTTAADAIDADEGTPKGSLDGVVLTVVAWGVEKIDGDMG
jgi:hypothetical protein